MPIVSAAEHVRPETEPDLKVVIDTTPALIWSANSDGEAESVNQHYVDYVGRSSEALKGLGWAAVVHPDDQERLTGIWKQILARGGPGEAEARLRRHDGEHRWFLLRVNPARDASGRIVKWYGVNTDIEDRKRAEEALASSERRLRETINTIPALVFCNRADGPNEFLNQRWHDYTGVSTEESLGQGWQSALHPDDLPRMMEQWLTMLRSGQGGEVEGRMRRHDGQFRWFLFRTDALRDGTGKILNWYGTVSDIEDRKRAEEELRRAHAHLSEAQRLSKTGSFTTDLAKDEHVWSDELYRICDMEIGSKITVRTFMDLVHPDDAPAIQAAIEDAISGVNRDVTYRLVTAKGVTKHLRTIGTVVDRVDGRFIIAGAIQDISESKRAEDALKANEAKLRRALSHLIEAQRLSKTGSFTADLTRDEHDWSDELYRIFELELGSTITAERIGGIIHPEDLALTQLGLQAEETDFEFRIRTPNGSEKHLRAVAHRNESIVDRRVFTGAIQDVTESKRAEEALSKARAELAQVSGALTLSALTASIAHEINQPLAGIVTNAGACLRMLAADPPNLDGAMATAQRTIRDASRATAVIERLRTLFARRQPEVEPVDLNDAAREVLALAGGDLQRNQILLRTEFAPSLRLVRGDRVQLQQVMLNLIRNAADAMQDLNGRPRDLLMTTANEGHDRVRVSVRDSGVGIEPAVMQKLFNAFYTTKSDGMGIGLSISRTIIESHEGRLWASANDGPGATFSFLLPSRGLDQVVD